MSLALYRRYRPETFAEVIGQEHVTEPLQQALRNDRVHHAYLFSGPRGCGKTTSARILARCLNCERGPTATPCGVCVSCVGLARGGPGTIDVIEIDAASHGGVDDARELRDKVFFAPAASRLKIYIVDEAHMVSSAGFNALLKVVEEPPEHVKFIFATTEPDKVIGTIRSRTHHYPFRLVPPGRLQDYLAQLCAAEGMVVEKPVLPLVVRAGRGSVRDALSVLDQLLAGAGDTGVTYALASALLGYTDASLLDDTLEAFAAGDGAAVFRMIDRVIEGGHDPRRFAEDLLERLRDLVIIDAVPDAPPAMFGDVPADQFERMRQQAGRFGSAELSRAADLVNTGLTEMRGATAPRLQLELICARVLLPEAADDARSLQARLDRLERRMSVAGAGGRPSPAGGTEAGLALGMPAGQAPGGAPGHTPRPAPATPLTPLAFDSAGARDDVARAAEPVPSAVGPMERTAELEDAAMSRALADRELPAAGPAPAPSASAMAVPTGGLDLAAVRQIWPDVLDRVKGQRRFTWTLLSHNAQVAALEGRILTLAMLNAGARDSFLNSGSDEIVRQALIDVLGVDWKVEALVDPSRPPAARATAVPGTRGSTGSAGDGTRGSTGSAGDGWDVPATAPATPPPSAPAGASRSTAPRSAARRAPVTVAPAVTPAVAAEDDVPSVDDPDADDSGLSSIELLQRNLGAKVIGEYDAD